ncbi:Na/Pi cotransporter family protein [Bacteriovorax sp. Seq25_V]|uniref:Na/Pi cotransporter family protein n=1 Tax=Bacteriovorax sp. Seq25_V TaxID=1201288 RepID=UPI000389DBCA|nr:Na/Pi cotransporter family protein [Bacteriovorax sp. Seq25_V]EQC47619.1 Na/Pi-cotransporter II-like protein [Bacteriovorax sp. Seq25_V]
MEVFKLIYSVLGGLGIFFYGMKSMSEALQQIAGDVIKDVINKLTKNRVFAVMVGIVVTMLVQSSSVTTVMVVGFVNASLMQLNQAIGVIFGANIGTTVTGWIISIKVGKYGLLLIGLGIFPLLFGKSNKWRQIGRIIFGIGMIFFGLKIMSDSFKPLREMPQFLDSISYFSGLNYGSYFASIIVGCILTMVVQSSSAMLGITIALSTTGVIHFHTAAALVLGENIGTTITALLAGVGGNVNAKRAARAHAIFNMIGVLTIFSVFPYYIEFIDWIVPGDANFMNPEGEFSNIAVHIATGHTIFNVAATILFLPFLPKLANLVTRITPETGGPTGHHLIMLGEPRDMIPAAAIAQAKAETDKMKDIVDRMYRLTKGLLTSKIEKKKIESALLKVNDYERITDNIQKEVTVFLIKVQEVALSAKQSHEAQSIIKVVDELESVADYIANLANYTKRTNLQELFAAGAGEDFFMFFDDVQEYYKDVTSHVIENRKVNFQTLKEKSEALRVEANTIRDRHLERVSKGDYPALTALTYSDMIVALRKIRSHSENIAEALEDSK